MLDESNMVQWSSDNDFPDTIDHTHGCIALESCYTIDSTVDAVTYKPIEDLTIPVPFAFGFVLPVSWMHHVFHKQIAKDMLWTFATTVTSEDTPDCVYRSGLYAKIQTGDSVETWQVVHDDELEWISGQTSYITVRTEDISNVYMAYQNQMLNTSETIAHKPAFVFGYTRVDLGQLPQSHTMQLQTLTMETKQTCPNSSIVKQMPITKAILTTLRTREQLDQPIAVLTENTLAPYVGISQNHPIAVQFMLEGTCQGVRQLCVVFQPLNHPPTVLPALVTDNTFAIAGHPIFPSTVTMIEIRLRV